MDECVREVLMIDIVGLLTNEERRLFLDTMYKIGSVSCQYRNETGKYWGGGFSDFYVMMLPDDSHTRDYSGPGVLTFMDDTYDDGYRVLFEILRQYLTVEQLMDPFVLWISW